MSPWGQQKSFGILGLRDKSDKAPSGPSQYGDGQNNQENFGTPSIDPLAEESRVQPEEAAPVPSQQKRFGGKITWKKIGESIGIKKPGGSAPSTLLTTPEQQESGQAATQTSSGDQQPHGFENPTTTLTPHENKGTGLDAYQHPHIPEPQLLQGHNNSGLQQQPIGYDITQAIPFLTTSTLQPPPNPRYPPVFPDPTSFLKLEGELEDTSGAEFPVMERARGYPRREYELPGRGTQRQTTNNADMQMAAAAAQIAHARAQPPKQDKSLPSTPSAVRAPGQSSQSRKGLQNQAQPPQRLAIQGPAYRPPSPKLLPLVETARFGDGQPGAEFGHESDEEVEESHSRFGDASDSLSPPATTPTGPPGQQRQFGLGSPTGERLPEGPGAPAFGVASEDTSLLETTTSATGVQYLAGSVPAQTPPPSLPRPHVADDTESRIKTYLEWHGVSLDPRFDVPENLLNWVKYEQGRLNNELKRVQDENQQNQQQQLLANQQLLTQAQVSNQAAYDQSRHYAQENKQKDLKISQLTSELDASRSRAAIADSKRKTAEDGHQAAMAELRKAQDAIEQLQQNNKTIYQKNQKNVQEINNLHNQIQDLGTEIASSKASYAAGLETKRLEHERALYAEREQRSALAAQHREQLAGRDRQATFAAQQHRDELADQDRQWRTVVQQHIDKLATQDHTYREKLAAQDLAYKKDLELIDHQMALLVKKHAEELKSREDKLAEVEASVQAEIERTQRENRAIISKQRLQIASYSKDSYVPIDDALFTRSFEALVQDINRLASRVRLPPTIDFDPSFDPTGCLERNARQRNWIWPRFVRGICWRVLLAGFFSLPFGFGALGRQGDGWKELRRMYQATAGMALTNDTDLVAAMPNERDVNKYRASYMEYILSAIRSESTTTTTTTTTASEMGGGYAVVFQKNVDAVGRELYDTLHHIVNGQLSPACSQQASAVAYKMGILALEMGQQRARVWLGTCRYREHSTPDEWKTEESEGGKAVVDLMVHPCLSRVGDGRGDLDKKVVVVRGEFVPLRGEF